MSASMLSVVAWVMEQSIDDCLLLLLSVAALPLKPLGPPPLGRVRFIVDQSQDSCTAICQVVVSTTLRTHKAD